ncbi:MAG: thermonuclease family protein, partial [Candidatus Lindowbacteria bacterium]|nr:thermonuclease family protein [Candidatus Lindowbacteria bacterium]
AHPNRGQFHPDPFGDEAGAFLRNRVLNKEVTLIIPTSVPTGKYGRTLALVACDGVMLNALLLEEGLARHFFINNQELLNAPLWFEVETKARKTKRGIWSLLPDTRVSS